MGTPPARVLGAAALVASVTLLLPACSESGAPPDPASLVRDSAGVAIVENGSPTQPALATWSLSERPLVVIGGNTDDPGHLLNQVVGGFRLDDGRIVVGDRGSGEVRFFSPDGRHLLTVGGQGEGPGEFRLLVAVDRLPGDTIVAGAWPSGLRVWWDSEGEYIADTQSGRWGLGLVGGRTLPDRTFLIDTYEAASYGNSVEMWAARGEESTFRTVGVLLRVTEDGEASDTLGPVIGEEWFKVGTLAASGSFANRLRPFTHRTHLAFNNDRIFLGESNVGEVRSYAYDGRLTGVIRWEGEQAPVRAADRRAFRQQVLAELNSPTRRPAFERWLSEVEYPESKPAFRGLATDRAGRLWVEAWTANEGLDRWLVFERDGSLSATVPAPTNARMLDASEGYLLVATEDELGVQTVRLFELSKG